MDNNGAYDYAADTRGYTYAAIAEYDDGSWSVRYGMALMPTVANGIDLQSSLRKARGDNYEVDYLPAGRWRGGSTRSGRVRCGCWVM